MGIDEKSIHHDTNQPPRKPNKIRDSSDFKQTTDFLLANEKKIPTIVVRFTDI
uniref:Uncharacterized protein n=1 Tax=Candidatus Kentrum sp. TUN TaxID=2126343 RepID=A0A450ZNJ3_9GAMM|nr:MAG: hypothetical protein BECKTUN1418D_GA0071000_10323 [Candidatus Kentron sp. TUN]VFK55538.1 MAG: hypothetical protein BECKTUN1418F_GA0071002_107016 [Candidatus Kentron sp. TUN]VFK61668.1 MAG: hypothetical protein BECKTUN1418E_GA0071001_106916 [Candidatus Kentron sp. TUN]